MDAACELLSVAWLSTIIKQNCCRSSDGREHTLLEQQQLHRHTHNRLSPFSQQRAFKYQQSMPARATSSELLGPFNSLPTRLLSGQLLNDVPGAAVLLRAPSLRHGRRALHRAILKASTPPCNTSDTGVSAAVAAVSEAAVLGICSEQPTVIDPTLELESSLVRSTFTCLAHLPAGSLACCSDALHNCPRTAQQSCE